LVRKREATGRTGKKSKKGKVEQKREEGIRGERVREELEAEARDVKGGREKVGELMKMVAKFMIKVDRMENMEKELNVIRDRCERVERSSGKWEGMYERCEKRCKKLEERCEELERRRDGMCENGGDGGKRR
jgi:predicted nuclease with TOPRIM domain